MAAAKNTCPAGYKNITPGELATTLVALHNWENTLEQNRMAVPAEFEGFFDPKSGGAKGIPFDKISDFAEKINTSMVCIKK